MSAKKSQYNDDDDDLLDFEIPISTNRKKTSTTTQAHKSSDLSLEALVKEQRKDKKKVEAIRSTTYQGLVEQGLDLGGGGGGGGGGGNTLTDEQLLLEGEISSDSDDDNALCARIKRLAEKEPSKGGKAKKKKAIYDEVDDKDDVGRFCMHACMHMCV